MRCLAAIIEYSCCRNVNNVIANMELQPMTAALLKQAKAQIADEVKGRKTLSRLELTKESLIPLITLTK